MSSTTIKKPLTRPISMSVHDMYLVATKQYNKFGIEGYDCPLKYVDPRKQVEDRKFAEYRKKKKFPKSMIKPTKKGHYLEDLVQKKKGMPGPEKYHKDFEWVSKADIEKGKRLPKNTTKNTYIDEILKQSKLNSVPGIGKYNVSKTAEQMKKEIEYMKTHQVKGSERGTTVESAMWLSAQVPGPGQYHPRLEVQKLKVNSTKPQDWIKKHTSQEKNQKNASAPGVGHYKDNFPADYETFGKLASRGRQKTIIKYMGNTERFKDPKKTKSLTAKILPAPNHYDLQAKWLGKDEGQKGNRKSNHNWMNRISRGISKSIYY